MNFYKIIVMCVMLNSVSVLQAGLCELPGNEDLGGFYLDTSRKFYSPNGDEIQVIPVLWTRGSLPVSQIGNFVTVNGRPVTGSKAVDQSSLPEESKEFVNTLLQQ